MPSSFLARHRTICAVLEDIKDIARANNLPAIVGLADEAKDYAQRMSAKLQEYKRNADQSATDDPDA